MRGLIGYTGFVGSNLKEQAQFDKFYNSDNISDIEGNFFDMVVCAGVYAEKWKANKYPEKDLEGINNLLGHLKKVSAERFILISTVDVYPEPLGVDENTPICTEKLHTYGKNRYYVEQFVRENFDNVLIVRLPALFGRGLKKNFVHDLINKEFLDYTHYKSIFQFYYLEHLWSDIRTALNNNLKLLNITSEPMAAGELAYKCFHRKFKNVTEKSPAHYDVKSRHHHLYGGENGYLYFKEEVLADLKDYLQTID